MNPTDNRLARRTGPLRMAICSSGLSTWILVPAMAAVLSSACGRARSESPADTATARADADSVPVRDTVAGTISYTARTDSHQVAIVIREEACSDVMSGEAFSHAVTVRVDGRELRGCGRVLATGEVENIYRLTPANRNRPA